MSGEKVTAGIGKGTPGPGRKKGVPNKTTMQLKEMILQALDSAGGAEYLRSVAESNPGPFLALVGKVLPMTVQGPGENGEHVFAKIVREVVDPQK